MDVVAKLERLVPMANDKFNDLDLQARFFLEGYAFEGDDISYRERQIVYDVLNQLWGNADFLRSTLDYAATTLTIQLLETR